ncbi:MAG: hypothetical protein ACOVQC_04890 [Flavobacterium sp.]|jgi:hypothetical protein
MTFVQKIKTLESYLNLPEQSYADSFKQDIIIYFEEDFTENNKELEFLNNLNTKEEIANFVDRLTSRFVLKFDSENEAENDFIYDYLING